MLKPKYSNILLCLLAKYSIFFLILGFKGNRFEKMVLLNSENTQDFFTNLFYYLIYVLIFIIFLILIFSAPIYYSLKLKKVTSFIFTISLILLLEYLVYTYLASQTNLWNGIYNAIISLLFLGLFFYKHIVSMFKERI
jgi:hypothetical protein